MYSLKEKVGSIDRIVDEYTLIGKDLFSKGTDISQFVGMKIKLATGIFEHRPFFFLDVSELLTVSRRV